MTGKDAPFMLSALPAWVKNTTLKGDFRLRYQYTDREGDVGNRNRGRYRLRLAVVTKLNEKVDVGFGVEPAAVIRAAQFRIWIKH